MNNRNILKYPLFCLLSFGALVHADPVCTSGSLLYSLDKCEDVSEEETIPFSEEDIYGLWSKLQTEEKDPEVAARVQEAFEEYLQEQEHQLDGDKARAAASRERCVRLIRGLWLEYLKAEPQSSLYSQASLNDFDSNPYITSEAKNLIKPWLISSKHPLVPILNGIFQKQRAILDRESMEAAGFDILTPYVSRSFITVARHPLMPGYLMKAYLDNELRRKLDRSHWRWLVARCEGAKKLRNTIKGLKSRYFTAPQKWLYPLPAKPGPSSGDPRYNRKYVVLIVEDMCILSQYDNEAAWKTRITPKHLDELYRIISLAGGGSYRPDNIPMTTSGKFAFIDTEYPDKKPNYGTIRRYLSSDMKEYWDQIVQQGASSS